AKRTSNGCVDLAKTSAGPSRLWTTYSMSKSPRPRSEKPRAKTRHDGKQPIRRCTASRSPARWPVTWPRAPSASWLLIWSELGDCASSRNSSSCGAPSTVASAPQTEKKRLDMLLVERGLAESRQLAQALILAGQVLVSGQKRDKAGALVPPGANIEVVGSRLRYASRGGLKLEGALEDFHLPVANKLCLDIGSSTGGFTDCLLQHGARRVYAVDVSVNQLAWKLQQDPRVVRVERNARNLRPEDLGEPVDLVT